MTEDTKLKIAALKHAAKESGNKVYVKRRMNRAGKETIYVQVEMPKNELMGGFEGVGKFVRQYIPDAVMTSGSFTGGTFKVE